MKNAATTSERIPSAVSSSLQNGRTPSGAIWQKRITARNEQFSSEPESRAETVAGASLCASGSQVWNGASPVLVPYPARISTNAALNQSSGKAAEQAARSDMLRPAAPAARAETAVSMVPSSANPIPTEQISRYFHMASRERPDRCRRISGALTSVVASTATQSRPKLRAVITRVIVARNPSRHGRWKCSRNSPDPFFPSATDSRTVCRATNRNRREVTIRKIIPASSSPIHSCPFQRKELMAGGSVTQQTVSPVWTHALSRSRIRAEFSRRIGQAATAAASGRRISSSAIIGLSPPWTVPPRSRSSRRVC